MQRQCAFRCFCLIFNGLQLGGSCGSFRLAPTLLDSNRFQSFSIAIECHHTVSMRHKTTQQWRTSSAPRRWWTVSVSVESFSLYPGFKNDEFDSCKGVSLMTHPMTSFSGQSVACSLLTLHFQLA